MWEARTVRAVARTAVVRALAARAAVMAEAGMGVGTMAEEAWAMVRTVRAAVARAMAVWAVAATSVVG